MSKRPRTRSQPQALSPAACLTCLHLFLAREQRLQRFAPVFARPIARTISLSHKEESQCRTRWWLVYPRRAHGRSKDEGRLANSDCQGNVYQQIIDKVIQASQNDFEEFGVDQSTLDEMKQVSYNLAAMSTTAPATPSLRLCALP